MSTEEILSRLHDRIRERAISSGLAMVKRYFAERGGAVATLTETELAAFLAGAFEIGFEDGIRSKLTVWGDTEASARKEPA